jgi:putative methyltransferase (TIGR04325 family)
LRSNLLYLTALILGKSDVSVVDFGGSTGDLGTDFLTAFPDATYTVVENPTMVALMKGRGPVGFECAPPAQYDVFFSSSTLQCVENPLEILSAAFTSARHAVVLARNSFADEDIYRVQRTRLFRNGSGPIPDGYKNRAIRYPHRTIRETAVIEIARRHDFRCVTRIRRTARTRCHMQERSTARNWSSCASAAGRDPAQGNRGNPLRPSPTSRPFP